MDFSSFDKRHYPTLSVRDGYAAWAGTYDDTVLDLMDIRLFERLTTVDWAQVAHAVDLACGTGRIGCWLKARGVGSVDGVDLTGAMLQRARERSVYARLVLADVAATGLDAGRYDLVTMSLADEHIVDLRPLYSEAARLLTASGHFVLVGYHPHFLMLGIPTHFDRSPGEPVAIESHVHLTSHHVEAARQAGFRLSEMIEGVIDEDWIAWKPKWAAYRHHPVSFALAWSKE